MRHENHCFTTSSDTLAQDIQKAQLEVLKKESQKLDLEIENLLLAKKKLKLEIMEIEERRGIISYIQYAYQLLIYLHYTVFSHLSSLTHTPLVYTCSL